jgi:hypothetical protein
MVSSKNLPWLNDGVTMVIRGHSRSLFAGDSGHDLSSVHGQPTLPAGAAGNSSKRGQDIEIFA